MNKDYNVIKLKNDVQQAVSEALADIAVAGLDGRIKAYKNGSITANEFLQYLKSIDLQ